MNLISRLKRLEQELKVDDEFTFIHIGRPCFTLYGDEARAYVEKERSAGRLPEPTRETRSGGVRFIVHRRKGRYPEALEG